MKIFFKKYGLLFFSGIFFTIIGYVMLFTPVGSVPINGQQAQILDGRFYYNWRCVGETLSALGDTGRKQYAVFHALDYVFLLSYGLVMMELTRLLAPKMKWLWISAPLLPAVFDIAENTLIRIASASYPDIPIILSKSASFCTTAKWSLGILWFVIFLILLSINLIRGIRNFKKKLALEREEYKKIEEKK